MSAKMVYKDYALKATVTNRSILENRLKELNAEFLGIDFQKDTYFKVARGKLKLRQGTIENLITHYERIDEAGVERTIVYRYDVNPTDDEVATLLRSYERLGTIEKERKIYYLGSVKIHLDLLDHQSYIEIEAIDKTDSKSNDALRDECLNIKERLGILDVELIKTGYWAG